MDFVLEIVEAQSIIHTLFQYGYGLNSILLLSKSEQNCFTGPALLHWEGAQWGRSARSVRAGGCACSDLQIRDQFEPLAGCSCLLKLSSLKELASHLLAGGASSSACAWLLLAASWPVFLLSGEMVVGTVSCCQRGSWRRHAAALVLTVVVFAADTQCLRREHRLPAWTFNAFTLLLSNKKESLSIAWARFSLLTQSGLDLSLPDHVLLQHFRYGLDKESVEYLNISARGSFAHKTTAEGNELLDMILENDSFGQSEAIPEVEIIHEDPLHVESEPDSTAESSSQSQEPEEEEIHLLEIPFQFEEDLFEDYGNTSNYSCEKRPPIKVISNEPLDKAMLKETVKKLTTIMSNEWLREGELSSEAIQIRCLEEICFAFDCLGDRLLKPTVKTFQISTNSTTEGLGIISGVPTRHNNVEEESPPLSLCCTEPLPIPKPSEAVMAISPFEPPESIFDESIEEFNEREDEFGETIDLSKMDQPSRAPIELKPLPSGLRYAFLNGDAESPVIISDELSERETTRLIAVLEKHRAAFGYSLQDLKGISPTLCTHRIPLDPSCTPSREPQRRLNNAMRRSSKRKS
uniref:Uncharacterized protein n=1 Tax=Oryza glaberrima TaxID=4538 RepID=I1PTU0_ORYGL